MPKKFDQEAKDRVVRLVEERILAENLSMQQPCQAIAPKLGVSWHTARQWTQQARRDGHTHQHQPEDLVAEVASCAVKIRSCETPTNCSRLQQLFRIGTRPKTSEMIQFIDKHRERFPIKFICKTLTPTVRAVLSHPVTIASPRPAGLARAVCAMPLW